MVLELYDLHSLALVILADELETRVVETIDVVWVYFISVTMTLVDLLDFAVELAEARPL
jgi:hypothetical protein